MREKGGMAEKEKNLVLFLLNLVHRLTSRNLALVRRVGGGRWGAQRSLTIGLFLFFTYIYLFKFFFKYIFIFKKLRNYFMH